MKKTFSNALLIASMIFSASAMAQAPNPQLSPDEKKIAGVTTDGNGNMIIAPRDYAGVKSACKSILNMGTNHNLMGKCQHNKFNP
jgi:hypothetical protein